MTYRGHISGGHILLDEPLRLPDGAEVHVQVLIADDEPVKSTRLRQALVARGLLEPQPPHGKDPERFRNWRPVVIQGKPLSQTIIEERR